MYVAVKGGAAAIESSWQLLAAQRRGDPAVPELNVAQIQQQLSLAVDRVMTEGSLYDRELAALAIKQSSGDLMEAIFLLRAYRTTLPRFAYSEPLDTSKMRLSRRISATFKDVPGGQLLGATHDYTQRLLDFSLLANAGAPGAAPQSVRPVADRSEPMPRVSELMAREGLMESQLAQTMEEPGDLTREPMMFPAKRALRLQALARGDEGWLLALGYSTQRGYASAHPFAGEIRRGQLAVEIVPDELGFAIDLGEVEVTECQMVNQFAGSREVPPQFTQGYGLAFGGSERKSMAMALVDRALRSRELGEPLVAPAQDEEFVLAHADSLESSGFVQHLKLPHYVDFQSELELVRSLRAAHARARAVRTERQQLRAERGRLMESHYNFAFLDEGTKKMIRRALLKAVAVPGYQVPFGSREMPFAYGWGTGGVQVTASIIGQSDVLKVIDQGSDDTTNAVNIRRFFARTTGVATTEKTTEATIVQSRHRIPEAALSEAQIIVFQVPMPEPLFRLEPRRRETITMHALAEYGLMNVKLYEDIAQLGAVSRTYDYPVLVNERYLTSPSPIPKFDNPKMHMNPALQLFGAGREKRLYAIPPWTSVRSLDFEDHPFTVQRWDHACALCGAGDSFLDEMIVDDAGSRLFVCSDSDYCSTRRDSGHVGTQQAVLMADVLAPTTEVSA